MDAYEDRELPVPDPNDFDPAAADVSDSVARRRAFSDAIARNGFPDTLVLSRDRAEDVFHDRRLEIVDYLAEEEPESVRALAAALDLDKGVVSRDLRALADLDVVEYEQKGRAKAPRLKHRHVAVEPIV